MNRREVKPYDWFDAVLADPALRPSAAKVAGVLYRLAPATGKPECWPSIETLCGRTAMGRRAIDLALADLARAGYLETRRRRRGTAVRTLSMPDQEAHGRAHQDAPRSARACASRPIKKRTPVRVEAHERAHRIDIPPLNPPERSRCAAGSFVVKNLEEMRRAGLNENPVVREIAEAPGMTPELLRESIGEWRMHGGKDTGRLVNKLREKTMPKAAEIEEARKARERRQAQDAEDVADDRAYRWKVDAERDGSYDAAVPYLKFANAYPDQDRIDEIEADLLAGCDRAGVLLARKHAPCLLARKVVERMIETGEIEPPDFVRPKLAASA